MALLQNLIVSAIDAHQAKRAGLGVYRVECNFEPSCSEYTKQAVLHYGAIKGAVLGVQRIRRCSDRDQVGTREDPLIRCDDV